MDQSSLHVQTTLLAFLVLWGNCLGDIAEIARASKMLYRLLVTNKGGPIQKNKIAYGHFHYDDHYHNHSICDLCALEHPYHCGGYFSHLYGSDDTKSARCGSTGLIHVPQQKKKKTILDAYANYAMGQIQVNFLFTVEPPTNSISCVWCLLWCMISALRFPYGSYGAQPLGFGTILGVGHTRISLSGYFFHCLKSQASSAQSDVL